MQASAEKIWGAAQQLLRTMLNTDIFNLWFLPIKATGIEGEIMTLEVANDFCEVWLKDNYLGLIHDVLLQSGGQNLKVKFKVNSSSSPAPVVPANEIKTKSKAASEASDRNGIAPREIVFNPRNTFESFVVGENNNHAHAAAMAVATAPGRSYNPLFVYGGVGLGKTHLLHAIGQHVAGSKKTSRVTYLTSERFTNEYIDAIQNNQLVRFRRKYRQADVLLIDDIQFLAGKERIQEEFFHTFNTLHESRKQIVLTCDRPAAEIQNLEHRLVSRFEWGLVTEMQAPDVETRMAILRKKEKAMGVELPDEIINFLAARIRTNIRRLEGALTRVASFASLTGKKVTLQSVEGLLREILHEEGRHTVNIDIIQKKVADHFDLRISDMISKRRPENIAFPRQIAMFLARQMTESSLNTIGEAFGGRDHGTVLHACRLVKDRMEIDAHVRQVVNYLEKQLLR
ncbi:MAG TPA: chromosomal replication initiator protein DnaA [Verrucomicrobiae bacterium]|jgi:chromosomal replication initiator protein|nr:chromosomal replication initiator protein DnaA [Verrucomicrobiae bacterium]